METLLIGVVIFLSSLLQGMFGFAFVMIALPLLSFFLSMKAAVALSSLFLALIGGILAFQMKGEFFFKEIIPLILGTALGIPVGVFFLMTCDEIVVKFVLGIVLISFSSYSLLQKAAPWKLPPWTGYLFGFCAGSLGGAFNITGPPVVLFLTSQHRSKITIFASLNFFFFITSLMVVFFHLAVGNITKDVGLMFAEFMPAMVIGLLSGKYLFSRISEDKYKKGQYLLLMAMGIMLTVQPLL